MSTSWNPFRRLSPQDEFRILGNHTRHDKGHTDWGPYLLNSRALNSVQSLADTAGGPVRLYDHFRCEASIIALCDEMCGYDFQVRTPTRASAVPWLPGALTFAETGGSQQAEAGSWYNEDELVAGIRTLERLLASGMTPDDIAFITPFRAQLERLQRAVFQRNIPVERGATDSPQGFRAGNATQGGMALGTVHRFQGGERRVVLFSAVVTDPGKTQFLNERPNLLNVTISRAQEHLIVFGNRRALTPGQYTRLLTRGTPWSPAAPPRDDSRNNTG